MRIVSVTAHAFGPLANATMEFADGMTVVFGPNESAKSSWHAATYVALCGRPSRVQGQEERLFEERHRPWDGSAWLAEAELRLDDGRRIGVRQNLLNRADRKAFDLDLGRDVSAEIMNDGSPDAARWLGLDRRSFRATACVGQTQILDVMAGAGGLQAFLQRAAASAGGGPPIEAIARIREFHDASVGNLRRARAPRTLAQQRLDEATEALRDARAVHAECGSLWVDVERARIVAHQADQRLGREEWAAAAAAATHLAERVRQAEELERRLIAVDLGESADDGLADDVTAALSAWPVEAGGAESPTMASVSVASELSAPLATEMSASVGSGLSDAQLWEMARDLDVPVPEADPTVVERAERARAGLAAAAKVVARSRWLVTAGAAGGLIGAGVIATGPTLIGGGLVLLGLVVVLIGVLASRGRPQAARLELDSAERAVAAQEASIAQAMSSRAAAEARARAAGLPPDPEQLRAAARARAADRAAVERDRYWIEHNRAQAEARIADAAARAEKSATRITALAARLGLTATTPGEAAEALRSWVAQRRADESARRDEAHALRERLASVLADLTSSQLRELATRAASEAAVLRAELADLADGETLDDYVKRYRARTGPDERPHLRQLAREAGEARRAAEVALDRALRDNAMPVGEAEELVAAAAAELDRIIELDETLSLTQRFLEQAQERAHRTIAPRLNDSVRAQLPRLTGGRYTEVTVDPENLAVTVRGAGGPPRPAHLLSFGTAEQIYLLLRIALAEHLVVESETCPLIFDDVTVHADRERTAAMLNLLLAASDRHQIIVFTQQAQVLDWARENLDGDRHAIRELASVTTV